MKKWKVNIWVKDKVTCELVEVEFFHIKLFHAGNEKFSALRTSFIELCSLWHGLENNFTMSNCCSLWVTKDFRRIFFATFDRRSSKESSPTYNENMIASRDWVISNILSSRSARICKWKCYRWTGETFTWSSSCTEAADSAGSKGREFQYHSRHSCSRL